MRGIRWIFDTTPSAEARSRAMRHANFLIGIMKKTNGKTIQQIWTDGTHFYHYKTSPFINQIRVWNANEVERLRFWVLADDVFYVLYKDALDVWKSIAVDKEYYLSGQGGYHWSNIDGAIRVNKMVSETVHNSVFNWQWNNFVPSYCRFGGMTRYDYQNSLSATIIDETTEPLLTDAPSSVNRETRTVPFFGMPWHYDYLDAPYPYPAITHAAPERSTHDMRDHATNPNDFWNTQLGSNAIEVINNRPTGNDISSLYDYSGALKRLTSIDLRAATPEEATVFDIDKTVPGWQVDAGTQTLYPLTKDWVLFPTYIGELYHNYYLISASPVGDRFIFCTRYRNPGTGDEQFTGNFYEIVLDHALQTGTASELKSEYVKDISFVTTRFYKDDNENYHSKRVTTYIERLYGYGYDEAGSLEEVEIRIITVDTEEDERTDVQTTSDLPPTDPDYWEQDTRSQDTTRDITYKIEVIINAVVIFTKTLAATAISRDYDQTDKIYYPYSGDIRDIHTHTDVYTNETTDYEIIIHSFETLTTSLSLTVIERNEDYGSINFFVGLSAPFTRIVTDEETTVLRGNTLGVKTYNAGAASLNGVPAIVLNTLSGVGTGSGSSQIIFAYQSPTNDFPYTTLPVRHYSTGTLRRFLRDFEGNVLTYCPTGQEAYWNTSSVAAVFGAHDSPTPPVKWRLDGLPNVFGLYDSAGIAIDLSSFGFTNVEAIGVVDALNIFER